MYTTRFLTLDFLNRCDPRVAEFYRYWESKRRGRRMPSRSDIDPTEIPQFLPAVLLVDVTHDPLQLTYRLVGTREVAARGYDPTGKSVFEHGFGNSLDEVVTNYKMVIARRDFVYDEDAMTSPDQTLSEAGTILLPLSNDGQNVDMVVVYTAYRHP